ncbi:MAG: M28 family metallopeptidase [Raineya sp.]
MKRKFIFLILGLFHFTFFVWAQQAQKDTLAKHFASYIRAENLSKHLYILASDSLQGRKTATEGQKKAARYIAQEMEKMGLKPANTKNQTNPFWQTFKVITNGWYYSLYRSRKQNEREESQILSTENVVGWIEGTDKKDEYVIITAHYDHEGIINNKIYYGADDNGSGTSSVLEIAKAFMEAKKAGFAPRRSIVFMLLTAEEVGLLGSQYYVDFEPLFPLKQTIVNLNTDMIGRIDEKYLALKKTDYVYLIGSDKLSKDLHQLQKKVNENSLKLTLDYTYNDPSHPEQLYRRSDHYNFAKKGIPVVFYFSGLHEDYHQPTDTPDKIHYPKMAKIAQLIFLTAWEIANREEKLTLDKEDR